MNPKFRFYHLKLNKIYEVVGIDHLNEQVDCILPEMNGDISNWDWNVGVLIKPTKLKDKNGVEIFEGDIVNVHEFINVGGIEGYEEGEREMIGIVRYGSIFNSPIPEWYLENSDDYISFSYMDLHDESFEVLGNIYEHPHLLEGDTEWNNSQFG